MRFVEPQTIIVDNAAWSGLPEELVAASKPIAEAGKYDDAIFAAIKILEATLQKQIGSKSIGVTLVAEAFEGNPPKVELGDSYTQEWASRLFGSSLSFIRNDRAHKSEPAIPCRSMQACIWFVNHVAMLLEILSQDKKFAPKITEISVSPGLASFRGDNLEKITRAVATAQELSIAQIASSSIDIALPEAFEGVISLFADETLIFERFCDSRPSGAPHESVAEVLDSNLQLFSDLEGTNTRDDYVGVLLNISQAGKRYTQVVPARSGAYEKGQFVSLQSPYDRAVTVNASWYRDPTSGRIYEAWSSSLIFDGAITARSPAPVTSALYSLPMRVSVEPGQALILRARGIETIGSARREVDLTGETRWTSSDPAIAYANAGTIYAKKFGSARISCSARGFYSDTIVQVENHVRGDCTVYFEGLRVVCGICADERGDLYITNQSRTVHRVTKRGSFEAILQLPDSGFFTNQVDFISVDRNGNLFITSPTPRRILMAPKKGDSFGTIVPIGPADESVKRSVAVDPEGIVLVGIMGPHPNIGSVVQIRDGDVIRSFATRGSAHNMVLGPDDKIYVAAASAGAIDVYSRNGELLGSLPLGEGTSIGAIGIGRDCTLYVTSFHAGELLSIRVGTGGEVTRSVLARGLGNPHGVAIDSESHAFVSDISSGRIYCVYL